MNSKKYILWLLLASAVYFPLFLHLNTTTLSVFDEARRGCNAIEMVQNGNFLVTHFEGEPDMWGTKPPLLIWIQATFMKIMGYNEMAVRLPSALAGLAMVLVLLFFGKNVLKNTTIGVFSVLILLTTNGYISDHVTRTGDFDGLLCLWLMLYLLSFFRFAHEEDPDQKKKYLYLTALFVFLAVFTKGIAGLFFLPGLFLFALLSKKVLPLVRNKHFWIAAGLAILGVMSFYLLRDFYNPGYLDTVWDNEVGGRYQNTLEGHGKPFLFYLKRLVEKDFNYWFLAVPFGAIVAYFGSPKERSLMSLLVINSIVFLAIISNAGTKHYWYSAPVLPSLVLMAAFGVAIIFKLGYQKLQSVKESKKIVYLVCFSLLIFAYPYYQILTKVYKPELAWFPTNDYSKYIRAHQDLTDYKVGNTDYNAHTLFYVKARAAEGKNVSVFAPEEQQAKGHQYLLCGWGDIERFHALHEVKVIEEWRDCQMVEIVGYK